MPRRIVRFLVLAALAALASPGCQSFHNGTFGDSCSQPDDCLPGYLCLAGANVDQPFCVQGCRPDAIDPCPPGYVCAADGLLTPSCLLVCQTNNDCFFSDFQCHHFPDGRGGCGEFTASFAGR